MTRVCVCHKWTIVAYTRWISSQLLKYSHEKAQNIWTVINKLKRSGWFEKKTNAYRQEMSIIAKIMIFSVYSLLFLVYFRWVIQRKSEIPVCLFVSNWTLLFIQWNVLFWVFCRFSHLEMITKKINKPITEEREEANINKSNLLYQIGMRYRSQTNGEYSD